MPPMLVVTPGPYKTRVSSEGVGVLNPFMGASLETALLSFRDPVARRTAWQGFLPVIAERRPEGQFVLFHPHCRRRSARVRL